MILTSPSLLVEGVRSGSRRRNAATPQAGEGIEPESRRTAPAWVDEWLGGQYVGAGGNLCMSIRASAADR